MRPPIVPSFHENTPKNDSNLLPNIFSLYRYSLPKILSKNNSRKSQFQPLFSPFL
nr:MAG TPA: hypothetical protein [Caudoviricetes sp.]